ncbi:hypothetical protein C4K23_2773 [Pseudomonas chlororaphis]|nr:hypothetical protein C4K23_2773 [Pseudomonas chlororaphis]
MPCTVESSGETKQAQKKAINTDQIYPPAGAGPVAADTVF